MLPASRRKDRSKPVESRKDRKLKRGSHVSWSSVRHHKSGARNWNHALGERSTFRKPASQHQSLTIMAQRIPSVPNQRGTRLQQTPSPRRRFIGDVSQTGIFPTPVARIFNPLYRRASSLRRARNSRRDRFSTPCRLETGDAAGWKPALRRDAIAPDTTKGELSRPPGRILPAFDLREAAEEKDSSVKRS